MSRRRKRAGASNPRASREHFYLGTAAWLLILCGGWLLAVSAADFWAGKRAEYWPTTEGTITAMATRQMPVGRFLPLQTWFQVSYEYRVDTVAHQGSRLAFGGVLPLDFDPQRLIAGRRVTVHYNPVDPGDAVLCAGAGVSLLIYVLVGGFFAAVGLGLFRHMRALPAAAAQPARRRR